MILDEPWSNLDEDAREVLAGVLNTLKTTTTILILSHERLPAMVVERIYCLNAQKGVFAAQTLSRV